MCAKQSPKAAKEDSKKPKPETSPSSAAPLSDETNAAMELPEYDESNDRPVKQEESENQPTPMQQAAANTQDTVAALDTILEMPPPESAEQENASKPPHLQTPPYVHHFDTYTLVQQVEKGVLQQIRVLRL